MAVRGKDCRAHALLRVAAPGTIDRATRTSCGAGTARRQASMRSNVATFIFAVASSRP